MRLEIGDRTRLDRRGDPDRGEVTGDATRRIEARGRPGRDLERHGHAHTVALEYPERPLLPSSVGEDLTGRGEVGSHGRAGLGGRPQRRHEVRARYTRASREDVVDERLPIDGELDR